MVDYQLNNLTQTKSKPIRIYLLIGIHLLFGVVSASAGFVALIWILAFLYKTIETTIRTKDRDNTAGYGAVYVSCMEILLRMNAAGTNYEFGKFAVTGILLTGLMVTTSKRQLPRLGILYLICLLPSFLVIDYDDFVQMRKLLSYNMSGPLCLGVSLLYFYKRSFNKEGLAKILTYGFLPLTSVVASIIFKAPKFENISFTSLESSKMTSGGFGPNQVCTALGFGFLLTSIAWVMKVKITKKSTIDIGLSFVFLIFASLTFSRGGVVSPIISFILAFIVRMKFGSDSKKMIRSLVSLLSILLVGLAVAILVDNFTNNKLSLRYQKSYVNVNPNGEVVQTADDDGSGINTSGRGELAEKELELFEQNPILGVGPGMAGVIRLRTEGVILPSHTEFTRLLSEHGIYGLTAMLILFLLPIRTFKSANGNEKVFLTGMVSLAIFTLFHSAMRLSVPAVAYGVGFIALNFSENPLETEKP